MIAVAAVVGLVVGCLIGFAAAGRVGRNASAAPELATGEAQAFFEADEAVAAGTDEEQAGAKGDETEAEAEAEDAGEDLEAAAGRMKVRIEELETDLRRYRRRATELLAHLGEDIEARWTALKLPRRVIDLPEEPNPEHVAELSRMAAPLKAWVEDLGLGTAELHFHLGLIEILRGRDEEALRCFEQSAFDGMVPEGWLASGDCQWLLQRPKTAAKSYRRCLDHKRMPVHIFERCAEVSINGRKYEDGLSILARIISRKAVPEQVFSLACRASLQLGDPERAVGYCEEGLKRHEDSALMRALMIVPVAEMGDSDRAEDLAQQAREIDPDCAEVPYSLGVMHMRNGTGDGALDLFEEALILRDEYPEALCCLGVIHNRRGEFKQALEYFQPAVKLKPDYAEAYFNMKESYEGLRDFDNAIAMLNRAVQLNPDYS